MLCWGRPDLLEGQARLPGAPEGPSSRTLRGTHCKKRLVKFVVSLVFSVPKLSRYQRKRMSLWRLPVKEEPRSSWNLSGFGDSARSDNPCLPTASRTASSTADLVSSTTVTQMPKLLLFQVVPVSNQQGVTCIDSWMIIEHEVNECLHGLSKNHFFKEQDKGPWPNQPISPLPGVAQGY